MMIADDKAKADIAERWETVRTFREMQNRTYISSIGGVTITESSLPDEVDNNARCALLRCYCASTRQPVTTCLIFGSRK